MPEGLLHEELVQVPHRRLAVGLGPFAVEVRPSQLHAWQTIKSAAQFFRSTLLFSSKGVQI